MAQGPALVAALAELISRFGVARLRGALAQALPSAEPVRIFLHATQNLTNAIVDVDQLAAAAAAAIQAGVNAGSLLSIFGEAATAATPDVALEQVAEILAVTPEVVATPVVAEAVNAEPYVISAM